MKQGDVKVRAVLSYGKENYSESYTLVTREDLGSFYYFEPAVQHINVVDVKIPHALKVGYIMGAGARATYSNPSSLYSGRSIVEAES